MGSPELYRIACMTGFAAVLAGALCGCGQQQRTQPGGQRAEGDGDDSENGIRGRVSIFHAASLARPFEALERRFEEMYPDTDVVRESSSSRLAIRKVTETGRDAELVASADEALLRDLMMPELVDWVAVFARNRVVIAYNERSKYRSEITAENWFEILLREDVNFGYADPNMAPVGYRTLLCWALADTHYRQRLDGRNLLAELQAACPQQFVRPHCNELIPLLESMTLDYTFQYRSVALQHHQEWLKLPDEIDLGSQNLSAHYASASVEIRGHARGQTLVRTGKPILYGLAVPRDAPNQAGAVAFLELLFAEEGQRILEENFQEPVDPPLCHGLAAAPAPLRQIMAPATY